MDVYLTTFKNVSYRYAIRIHPVLYIYIYMICLFMDLFMASPFRKLYVILRSRNLRGFIINIIARHGVNIIHNEQLYVEKIMRLMHYSESNHSRNFK